MARTRSGCTGRPRGDGGPGDDRRVGTAVVEAVGEAAGVPAAELPPLGDAVDVDALERLVASSGPDCRTTFRYHGHEVVVAADGSVDVAPAE